VARLPGNWVKREEKKQEYWEKRSWVAINKSGKIKEYWEKRSLVSFDVAGALGDWFLSSPSKDIPPIYIKRCYLMSGFFSKNPYSSIRQDS
jgi:hypothetical protein